MEGKSPGLHVIAQISARWVGLVELFTSVRPLPQAEDDTSHRKAKAAVMPRS